MNQIGDLPEREDADPDTPIDMSAWQMWLLIRRTFGIWVALRTGTKYLYMWVKGNA